MLSVLPRDNILVNQENLVSIKLSFFTTCHGDRSQQNGKICSNFSGFKVVFPKIKHVKYSICDAWNICIGICWMHSQSSIYEILHQSLCYCVFIRSTYERDNTLMVRGVPLVATGEDNLFVRHVPTIGVR